jgi:tripartite-type tricarboxylate transporter receptor subunit TctC
MAKNMGQSVLVENRPGGNFIIAGEAVAKSPPDGHTLLMGIDGAFTLNPILYANKLPHDVERDFTPISLVALQSIFLVASAKAPARTFKELIVYAKANPGKVSFGTSSLTPQLIGEQIRMTMGVDILHVPFKGAPPVLQALFAGDVDFAIVGILPYATYTKDGKLVGLATTGGSREAALPTTPTLTELGFPDLEYRQWFGLFAPAGTAKPIIARLHTELAKALAEKETRDSLISSGMDPMMSTPEELTARIRLEHAKWSKVIKASGIKLE